MDRFEAELIAGFEVSLEEVAGMLDLKKETIIRTIKKLAENDMLEYRPPFKGTEIKVLKNVSPDDLDLDFSALKNKEQRAYGKLDEMESYVYHPSCRQEYILKYFGDPSPKKCGKCDVCLKSGPTVKLKSYLGEY
jgi:ATP-dependent DNA helicase RecQ